eukprot:CAMPEP_0197080152 /NCGR_PEP_ID=MMETSP1384-20130603/213986_1 /TAXON_ID=29189 /ORGANISM="Ammonia sp." /LENGTH=472 /DNA_ID=CAMNT_0042519033 /DNA_START=18 /DNA_END=1436 /DNA_ORIENTATION=-
MGNTSCVGVPPPDVNILTIKVCARESHGIFQDDFSIQCVYSQRTSLRNIVHQIIHHLKHTHYDIDESYPMQFEIREIRTFDGDLLRDQNEISTYLCTSIQTYDPEKISQHGLTVVVSAMYEHKVRHKQITCKHMRDRNTLDPLQCPVYYAMKQEYQCTQENMYHLHEFVHFKDEVREKPVCKYKDECKVYTRMEQQGGSRMEDECHMKLYRHPPRSRQIQLAENIHSLVINTQKRQNHSFYQPTEKDRRKYQSASEIDGYLAALIEEVKRNGFSNDLCLQCKPKDSCKHKKHSILQIVDEKMNHIRHKTMGSPLKRDEMLALVLYTGCECNYDLCRSQRNGDYAKWKWFDYCLFWAIWKLSKRETGSFSVYTGLNGVQLPRTMVPCGYFKTYVSTSWRREIAEKFMGGNSGMIIQFDEAYKNNEWIFCCDVSWISKFPDECEVLFARSDLDDNRFQCVVMDTCNGIQTVALQ